MVPVGAIVAILLPVCTFVAVLLFVVRQAAIRSLGQAAPIIKPVSRGSTTAYEDYFPSTVLIQLIGSLLLLSALTGVYESQLWATFVVMGTSLVLFPWWVCRLLLIPMGLVRSSYWVSWLSRVEWRRDKPGGPALAGALALVRAERPSEASMVWLEGKLEKTRRPIQASGIAALGLIAAARGDLDRARVLMSSIELLDRRLVSNLVAKVSQEWLALDAATRGEWDQVLELCTAPTTRSTRTIHLLRLLATHYTGQGSVSPGAFWFWWACAPRRFRTFSFVRRTMQRAPVKRTAEPPLIAEVPPHIGPLGSALYKCIAVAQLKHPPRLAVLAAADEIERQLESQEVRVQLFERATLLGGGDPDECLDQLREVLSRELGALLQNLSPLDGPTPSLLQGIASARTEALFSQLEAEMARVEARRETGRFLPGSDEWRCFLTIRSCYLELSALLAEADRIQAFDVIGSRLLNFAAKLFNVRHERPLANAIFVFLREEARRVGSEEDEHLNAQNAQCGL